jgi:hypothetical protein
MKMRVEKDTMGSVEVPADKYWGAQTQRAIDNFKIGGQLMPVEIIRTFAVLKKAAAVTNLELGVLPSEKCDLISKVCDEIMEGKLDDEFPLIVWQTGSGTHTNMNLNEVIANRAEVNSYLYKDILTWERVQKPDRLEKLVQALALQVGNEVSYKELGRMCALDNETVEKYILLLERAFIVFRLSSFSRNLRSELKRSRKIYFYDNGLRNSVINPFNPLGLRNDTGSLWENFIISERLKHTSYEQRYLSRYF